MLMRGFARQLTADPAHDPPTLLCDGRLHRSSRQGYRTNDGAYAQRAAVAIAPRKGLAPSSGPAFAEYVSARRFRGKTFDRITVERRRRAASRECRGKETVAHAAQVSIM